MTSDPTLQTLIEPSALLDFRDPAIAELIASRGWARLPVYERIGAVYGFVRDEIAFGYNASDDLPASRVLQDGIGQCNTKATLLMALLRAVGVPCRFHGFTIDKALQEGAVTGLWYRLAPRSILHSWVEVYFDGRWVNLEGFILDNRYLAALQSRFAGRAGPFCGFGVATPDLQNPPVNWDGRDTYIQRDGIDHDLGVFDTPDRFYERHCTNLVGPKRWFYVYLVRHLMNRNVESIRGRAARHPGVRAIAATRAAARIR
jgi:hypothetical protein